jgi:F-type H+-transporting ATPase subunit gamma
MPRVATRGFATEKQIAMRIVSTNNLRKITSSMKMVSSAKMQADLKRVEAVGPFNEFAKTLCGPAVACEDLDVSDWPQKNLIVAVSSDKGLCGGVNAFIARNMKKIKLALEADGKELNVMVWGEKGRSQLFRVAADNLLSAATDAEYPATFASVGCVASDVAEIAPEYDGVHIIFNRFESAIAYHTSVQTLMSLNGEGDAEPMMEYEFEPDTKSEILNDLGEFMIASQLYYSVLEGAASEQSSRTQAMENASKNAGELVEALTLQYNKARQTRITTELIEIISGASALED